MAWLNEPIDKLPPNRRPDLLKLFFAGSLDKESILEHLRRQLELHRAGLDYFRRETAPYMAQIIAATGKVQEGVMWGLVQQLGEEVERAYIRWLEQTIEVMTKDV